MSGNSLGSLWPKASATLVLDTTRCVYLAAILGAASTGLLSISPPRLTAGDFRQFFVGTSAFEIAELRRSQYQLVL
jgi:hypothetical protein